MWFNSTTIHPCVIMKAPILNYEELQIDHSMVANGKDIKLHLPWLEGPSQKVSTFLDTPPPKCQRILSTPPSHHKNCFIITSPPKRGMYTFKTPFQQKNEFLLHCLQSRR